MLVSVFTFCANRLSSWQKRHLQDISVKMEKQVTNSWTKAWIQVKLFNLFIICSKVRFWDGISWHSEMRDFLTLPLHPKSCWPWSPCIRQLHCFKLLYLKLEAMDRHSSWKAWPAGWAGLAAAREVCLYPCLPSWESRTSGFLHIKQMTFT